MFLVHSVIENFKVTLKLKLKQVYWMFFMVCCWFLKQDAPGKEGFREGFPLPHLQVVEEKTPASHETDVPVYHVKIQTQNHN